MKDILWTAYLAVMIILVYSSISKNVYSLKYETNDIGWGFTGNFIQDIISCIMIAIWYMYFLH